MPNKYFTLILKVHFAINIFVLLLKSDLEAGQSSTSAFTEKDLSSSITVFIN